MNNQTDKLGLSHWAIDENIKLEELKKAITERPEDMKAIVEAHLEEQDKNDHLKAYYIILLFAEFYRRSGEQVSFENPKLRSAFNIWRSAGHKVNDLLKRQFGKEYEEIVQLEKDVFKATFDSVFSPKKTADEKVWLLNVLVDLSTNRNEIVIEAEHYAREQRETITHEQFSEFFWWFRNNVLWYIQQGDTVYGAFNRIIVEQSILPDKDGKFQ